MAAAAAAAAACRSPLPRPSRAPRGESIRRTLAPAPGLAQGPGPAAAAGGRASRRGFDGRGRPPAVPGNCSAGPEYATTHLRQTRTRGPAGAQGLPPARIGRPWRLFGISSNLSTLAWSSRSSSGPAGGASDGCGLGRAAAGPDRRRSRVRHPRPGRFESSFRTDQSNVRSCSATGTDGERMADLNRRGMHGRPKELI